MPYPIIKIVDGDQEGIRLGLDGPSGRRRRKRPKRAFSSRNEDQSSGLGFLQFDFEFLALAPFLGKCLPPLKVLRFDPSPTFTV